MTRWKKQKLKFFFKKSTQIVKCCLNPVIPYLVNFCYRAGKKKERQRHLAAFCCLSSSFGTQEKEEKTQHEQDSQTWQRGDTMCSALIPPRPVSISMTSFLLLPLPCVCSAGPRGCQQVDSRQQQDLHAAHNTLLPLLLLSFI